MRPDNPRRLVTPQVAESHLGELVCLTCPPRTHFSCEHIGAVMRAGDDTRERFERRVVPMVSDLSVPLFGTEHEIIVWVSLDPADSNGMRIVRFADPRMTRRCGVLGYVSTGEGRWALRELILSAVLALDHTKPRCSRSGCSKSDHRRAQSHLAIADTWTLFTTVPPYCFEHREQAAPNDDLVPDV